MQSSTFAKLPAEVRNHIWELTVTGADGGEVELTKETEPGITRTCRQIRADTRGLYYHANTFIICIEAPQTQVHSITNALAAQTAETVRKTHPDKPKQMLLIKVYCAPTRCEAKIRGMDVVWYSANTYAWDLVLEALVDSGLEREDVEVIVTTPKIAPVTIGWGPWLKKTEENIKELQKNAEWFWDCAWRVEKSHASGNLDGELTSTV